LGARTGGAPGETDSWSSLSAAVNLQLIEPRPHHELHPTIAALLTPDLQPAAGMGGVPIRWYRPRHVAERGIVLRAVQSGAIVPPPQDHPVPLSAQQIYRWSDGNRVHLAAPQVKGLRPARWAVSWAPGTVVRVDVGETYADVPQGSGRGPHPAPSPLGIPQ